MAAANLLKGRKVVVVGANDSGLALTKFLITKGAQAKLVDKRAQSIVEPLIEAAQLDAANYTLECGEFGVHTFHEAQLIVVTPAFPIESRVFEASRAAGIEIVSELEFVGQCIEEPVVAVTGTNGKSTTAAMAAAILENSGKSVFNNVNQALSEYLLLSKPADVVIAVADSFQLDGISTFKPAAVVVTNISEDNLHRYPTFEAYALSHRAIFKNADENTVVVMNAQDNLVLGLAPHLGGQTRLFSSQEIPAGIESSWHSKTHLFVRSKEDGEAWSLSLAQFRVRGSHNRENLSAAVLVSLAFGGTQAAVEKVVQTFSALKGRVEFTKRMNSVAFYCDAFATNVQAVIRTLQAFNEPVILISGGRDKNQDYSPMIPHIRQRVKNLILVGEAKEKMNRAIGDYTETFLVGTLEEAIILAYQKSRSGDVVLFSPACDSGDQFETHQDKAEFFRKLVGQIAAPRRPNVF